MPGMAGGGTCALARHGLRLAGEGAAAAQDAGRCGRCSSLPRGSLAPSNGKIRWRLMALAGQPAPQNIECCANIRCQLRFFDNLSVPKSCARRLRGKLLMAGV